jgi:predicted ester cyclase
VGCHDHADGRCPRRAHSARYTYGGRHTGTFLGVPASGAQIEMHSIDIWRVRDGLFAEHWDELNTLELFQQIGAIPRSR